MFDDLHRNASSIDAGVAPNDATSNIEEILVAESHVRQDQWVFFVAMQQRFKHLHYAIVILRCQLLNNLR